MDLRVMTVHGEIVSYVCEAAAKASLSERWWEHFVSCVLKGRERCVS